MSIDNFVPGEVARLTLAVINVAGAAVDPGALRLKIKPPSGTVTTYTYGTGNTIAKDSTGVYHADIALSSAGVWTWRWELDSPNAGAAEGAVNVLRSRVI